MEIWILSHGYDYGNVYDKYKWNEEARFLGAYYTKEEGLKNIFWMKKKINKRRRVIKYE